MRILITGGAGFVGSSLAGLYRTKYPQAQIVVFDNLKRRGSELNIPRLKSWNVEFCHGDIRSQTDFGALSQKSFDLFIEASADPSVVVGAKGDSAQYAIQTNLFGTVNCLEFARQHCGAFLFLSTSRVYSLPELLKIPLQEGKTRLDPEPLFRGISETFSTKGVRSFYGTTKLSSEMLIEEYVYAYQLKALINRCSVICGPWQMGKVDQGVFSLWMVRHFLGGNLEYTGFGGKGFQVRDLLHPEDLFKLLELQFEKNQNWAGQVYNVGGGFKNSISLCELTRLCQQLTGKELNIGSAASTHKTDVPYYVTNHSLVEKDFQWQPTVSVKEIMEQVLYWLKSHRAELEVVFP